MKIALTFLLSSLVLAQKEYRFGFQLYSEHYEPILQEEIYREFYIYKPSLGATIDLEEKIKLEPG